MLDNQPTKAKVTLVFRQSVKGRSERPLVKATETMEAVSWHRVEERGKGAKVNETLLPPKNRGRIGKKTEKKIVNLSGRKKIAKKADAGCGQATKWEVSLERQRSNHEQTQKPERIQPARFS
jgi:hypothetical protein